MRTKRILFMSLAALCVVVLGSSSALAQLGDNIVRNGNFERPEVTPGPFTTFEKGDTIQLASEWRVTRGSVDLVEEPAFEAASGDQSLDLNGDERGTVIQDLTTVAGADYVLRFAISGNPQCDTDLKRLAVSWDDQLLAILFIHADDASAMDLTWRYVTFEVTASSVGTALRFASRSDGLCGPMIDNVSVRPVED
jgi:choice-of-anchor C domain-containing protein